MSEPIALSTDPRPLRAFKSADTPCFDCLSSLSAMVVALDAVGHVVYGNARFSAEVPAWKAGVGDPVHLADIWPAVAAVLPDLSIMDADTDDATHIREVQLSADADSPRDHLVFVDPLAGGGCGRASGWLLTLIDISHIRQAERQSRSSLEIEMFLSRLSSRFVGSIEVDDSIRASLEDMGKLTGAQRVFFSTWDPEHHGQSDILVWDADPSAPGNQIIMEHRDALKAYLVEQFDEFEIVEVDDLRRALPEAYCEAVMAAGDDLSGSMLMVPLLVGDQLGGAVGLRFRADQDASDSTVWVVLDIFCHILERVIRLKRSDEALRRTNRELKEKSAQLVQSEKMASIGQMAAGVAHEINNPVGYIMGNLSTLQDYASELKRAIAVCRDLAAAKDELPAALAGAVQKLNLDDLEFVHDDLDDLLSESVEGCERVRDIVQNLKGFARLDDNQMASVDLHASIESTLKVVWNELKYTCEVVREFGELPPVTCYAGKLNQVIMNLLVNAAHAIEDKGTITIATSHEGSDAVIKVTDTGQGIPPENLARLFDPFFTTKEPGRGTGLGLYICHTIMEEHAGSISVESTVGVGTTFTVRLPLQPEPGNGEVILG